MKRILLVDASPRKNGNSEIIVDMLASDLNNEDVTVFLSLRHIWGRHV